MAHPEASNRPRPTVGHHFGSLLRCPERAWLDYWGDPRQKLRPPSFLLKHQQEGFQHEAEMCRKLYPDAVRVSDDGTPDVRLKETLDAIRSGAPAILQAYLREGDDLGVIDVLELEDVRTPVYRVGEFKRSASLQTEHVLQVRWYAELLERLVGARSKKGFFILGDGTRSDVDLADVEQIYQSCKGRLRQLRENATQPGPHLCKDCGTCPWRGVCIPRLADAKHVSLLPGLNRGHARRLAEAGLTTWPDVVAAPDEQLAAVGVDGPELKRIRAAGAHLRSGNAVTRYALRPTLLTGITTMCMEYKELEGASEEFSKPVALWHETSAGVERLPIADGAHDDQALQALKSFLCTGALAAYGARDVIAVMKLCEDIDAELPECLDIFAVVESYLHAPLLGLELGQIVEHLGQRAPATPAERVQSIRLVVDWLCPSAHSMGAA